MQRFSVQQIKNKIYFSKNDINHITKVLRKKIGDTLECIDQDNCIIKGKIKQFSPFVVDILSIELNDCEPYKIDLYVSIIKKNNFELIVQKMNELNINSITPVIFDRTQQNIKLDYERLNRIAIESSKQCKRVKNVLINKEINFNELIKIIKLKNNFIFANEKQSKNCVSHAKVNYNNNINLIIGPEGGFNNEEIENLSKLCSSVALTRTILRAETASIYLVSCVIEEIKKNEK